MNIKEKQQELVEQIAADIAAGKPFFWESGVLQSDRPKNLTREGDAAFYRGGNRVRLTYTAICKGYTDNRWATFKQAQAIGAKIKKGEKGTPIVYYQFESEVWKKNPQTGKSEPVYEIDPKTGKKFIKKVKLDPPLVKGSIVFNAEQMENVPPLPARERVVDAENEKMEQMLANSEAPIHYDQSEKNSILLQRTKYILCRARASKRTIISTRPPRMRSRTARGTSRGSPENLAAPEQTRMQKRSFAPNLPRCFSIKNMALLLTRNITRIMRRTCSHGRRL